MSAQAGMAEVRITEHPNERIRRRTRETIRLYGEAGGQAIQQRMRELDEEWDVGRALATTSAAAILAGAALGARDRRWLVVPAVAALWLLQYARGGWSAPREWLRRMGVRTAEEIGHERYALKTLRGDFRDVAGTDLEQGAQRSEQLLEAVER